MYITFFLNGPILASFLFIFVFSNKNYNFYNKYVWNNVHRVYGAGIRTHDIQDMSLLPQPLDQGSCLVSIIFVL